MKWLDLALVLGWGTFSILAFCGVLTPTPVSYGLACVCLALSGLNDFIDKI